ncbi:MAG: peptidase and chymotrypsin/Hap [Bryobacterales bacterium]|nr:peptidase and chymotrypsin/Hap [Bryobacterales bacterium]
MLENTRTCLLVFVAFLMPPAIAQDTAAAPEKKIDSLREFSTAMEALSNKVSHAVVQIFSTGYSFNEEGTTTNTSLISRQRSSGSGVILTPDGYIVTNSHVVQTARRVQVQLLFPTPVVEGHRRIERRAKLLDAKVIGLDREADLAVIKIDMTGLPHLAFGDSEKLRQGQVVIAVGNPFGLENSVSMGVVSSTGRQLKTDDPMSYIQTDASINPGNSGGPLLDTEGHVVGINTFIYTQSGGNEGIGFAIPSNLVNSVYSQIKKSGHVHRGEIGVSAQTITPQLTKGLSLPQDYGVLLADVDPEGPADTAGVKVGDIVQSVDGRFLDNARQLELYLYRKPVGDKVQLKVLRGSDTLETTVEVVERDSDPQRFADMVTPEKNTVARLGILGIAMDKKTADMLPDLRRKYGVIVGARSQSSPYSGNGALAIGDVIYSVNNAPVADIETLRKIVDAIKPGDPAVLQVERDGKLLFLALELE